LGEFSLVDDGESDNFQVFTPGDGQYTVSENVPADWFLTDISCDDPSADTIQNLELGEVVINLDENEVVVCTFTNEQAATLIVNKVVVNDNDGTATTTEFSFQLNEEAPVVFEEDGQNVLTQLSAGPYAITEAETEGYTPSYSEDCEGTLAPGETKTCTITNDDDAPAQLTIVKYAEGGDGTFGFEITGEAYGTSTSIATIEGEGSAGPFLLDAGTYQVFETSSPGGWEFESVYCAYESGDGIPMEDEDGEEITVLSGEIVTCYFTNTLNVITLTGAKWHDFNADGDWYQYGDDPAEPGLEGWTIFATPMIQGEDEGVFFLDTEGSRTEKETVTDDVGNYAFYFEPPAEEGWWRISEEQQDGWTQTAPEDPGYYDVFISTEGPGEDEGPGYDEEEEIYEDYDFGNWQNAVVQVLKWNDVDASGTRGTDDLPLELWPMALGRVDGESEGGMIDIEIVELSLTGQNGIANVFAPLPGQYVLLEGLPAGWEMTYPAPRPNNLSVVFAPGVEPITLGIDSFFDIFVDVDMHGQEINQGQLPGEEGPESVPLEFGNHELAPQTDGPIFLGGSAPPQNEGQVLGAATTTEDGQVLGSVCELPVTTYLRRGGNNDPAVVMQLQAFLNAELGLNIPLTGFFGPLTEAAVKAFQLKYYDEILKPWVDLGLLPPNTATGIVYKTTLWKIQQLGCPGLDIPEPTLP
jgi:hypothetical protein